MNANELAEDMERGAFNDINYNKKKAADFVRQQQAEIEALKLQLHTTLTNRDLRTYDGKLNMNNEPVAWINRKGKDGEHGYLEWDKDDEAEINTPLYTHPAKTLTDEEIQDLWAEMDWSGQPELDFARAILRKAQEK